MTTREPPASVDDHTPADDHTPVDDHTPADDPVFAEETLRLAELAFDRVMSGVDPRLDTVPPELKPADAVRWIGDRVTELVAGFAELPLDRLVDSGCPSFPSEPPVSEPEPRGEPLTMTASRGGLAEVRIWIHPIGELTTGTLRFRVTDLLPATGEALPGGAAVFAPAGVDLPLGTAASVLLRYPVPAGVAPGRYHGMVLAGGATDAVLPITAVIT
ncbi:MAG TPA: hypothetical protein VFR88_17180 [Microlunatus sp.]|nr:hypothetical protein [Microlunatus sp.]